MENFLNALIWLTNFSILPAITYGSQLALGALGITLVFSILRFGNFAHGETMSIGTAFTILFMWLLWRLGDDLFPISLGPIPIPTALIALIPGLVVTALVVLLTDMIVYRYYRKQRVTPTMMTIVSVGVMFFYAGLVRFIIGTGDQAVSDLSRSEKFITKAGDLKKWARGTEDFTWIKEGIGLQWTQAYTVIIVIVLVALLFWFLNKTRTGKSMRAYSDNEDLALLSGINPDRVVLVTWLIGGSLAVVAGVLFGMDKSFKPFTYFQLLLPMFAAAIVGGIGQPVGAIVGGYIVAFSEILLTTNAKKIWNYVAPSDLDVTGNLQLLSTDYKFAVSFIILVLVLLVRPTGIFKGKVI